MLRTAKENAIRCYKLIDDSGLTHQDVIPNMLFILFYCCDSTAREPAHFYQMIFKAPFTHFV